MTKIDIYSGFLGAGKTTLIKHMITSVYQGEKLVLIENEFGEIGIDGGFLKDAGIEITEMNSGCICCSLVGDFSKALGQVIEQYHPDRILIEPSGVGKLSDVIRAVKEAHLTDARIEGLVTVVDAKKCRMYMKNFGEFFDDQVTAAHTVIMSHTDTATAEKVEEALALVRAKNPEAHIVTTPVSQLSIEQLREVLHSDRNTEGWVEEFVAHHEHHHDHHEYDEHCTCGCHGHDHEHEHHHHEHNEHCTCSCHGHDHEHEHHHHHEHDEHCTCSCHGHDHEHEHHHHHEHDEHCTCGCHDHEHDHHHHHADEVFSSWGRETTAAFTEAELETVLDAFDTDPVHCGMILRSKGIVRSLDGRWLHFDYIPGDHDIRYGAADTIGKLCVIGSHLNEAHIAELFGMTKEN